MSTTTPQSTTKPLAYKRQREAVPGSASSISLPAISDIRKRFRSKLDEYSETGRLVQALLDEQDAAANLEDLLMAAEVLEEMIERCRKDRLRVSKPFKARSKDAEGIFLPVEKEMSDTLKGIKAELGKVLPDEYVDWLAISIQRPDLDWSELGPYLSDATIIRAANNHMNSTGHRLSGIEYRPIANVPDALLDVTGSVRQGGDQ